MLLLPHEGSDWIEDDFDTLRLHGDSELLLILGCYISLTVGNMKDNKPPIDAMGAQD